MTNFPRISKRIGSIAESATLKVDAKAKALQAEGRPVISYAAGEPDFPTPAHAIEAAEQCGILSLPEIRAERPLEAALEALEPERPITAFRATVAKYAPRIQKRIEITSFGADFACSHLIC